MTIEFYEITSVPENPGQDGGNRKYILIDENGKQHSCMKFIWYKDPEIPAVEFERYCDGNTIYHGMKHVNDWVETHAQEDEIVRFFYSKYDAFMVFGYKETYIAFKLMFNENSDIDISWTPKEKIFEI